ncbi:uncharacterized protein N7469_006340 [Penicillium citrinum]|uniref:DnaJ homologue subfamily C member 28 conserved domain-containing protein n=1 Tax=Penicillium citrinum TaxID=5077 RepID=A0A9W9NXW2_PENCI|nr:uncharacterized protein N7469_006340 [Penicillium citrinum]KAJ5231752.1 hypothetical protein N7469_006340 [Penicillium citrinum]
MNGAQLWSSQLRRAPVCAWRSTCTTPAVRRFTAACPQRQDAKSSSVTGDVEKDQADGSQEEKQGESAMSRRLSQMTEDAMVEGGRSARRNIEHAGFSEDLKKQLEERVLAASFRSEHAAAHSILDMPASAGQGTRETAAAQAWTGTETLHDSALRMLDDASKPIRTPYKIPQPVDLKPAPKPKRTPGERLADAKDRTSTYTLSQAPGFSEEERENLRREMRENLTPGAHSMPISIQGLSSLANERIEDAIARGQFKKIKRGKETGDSPPWIEKQQELSLEISRFRQRLRVDWRRHAARLIASQGGSLEAQMNRAKGHAAAEVRLKEQAKLETSLRKSGEEHVVSEIDADGRIVSTSVPTELDSNHDKSSESATNIPHLPPLRDHTYLSNERSYHELAVKHINTIARSYNLQAPRSAQKPYINLDRELNACFAEVAPQLADEIRRRATERARSPLSTGGSSSSMFGSLGTAQTTRVYDEDKDKAYGLKEMWRDLFSKEQK